MQAESHSDQLGALLGALAHGRLQMLVIARDDAQPAIDSTLLPRIGPLRASHGWNC